MALAHSSALFFIQLLVIVAAARLVGWLGNRFFAQPKVVGEMIAGVLLGPSLFGFFLPDWQAFLFPQRSVPLLYVLAQLGVGLYMFVVGMGFERTYFRSNVRSATAVSISGMAAPFLMAVLLTPWLMSFPGLFSPRVSTLQATLFIGACISITAFPMLARIIQERGLTNSALGTLSLSAGAIDDAGAWIVLAIVLATFGDGTVVAVKAIGGAAVFAVLMISLAPRLLAPLGTIAEREQGVRPQLLSAVLILFLISAFLMDWVGMHAVFGGFLLGTAMPRGLLTREIKAKLEPLTLALLLPIFFTYSGLNTQLDLVADPKLLTVAVAVLAASIFAKGAACWAAARWTGQDNATALGIGALMNARGLMELIIINIGLQRGIIGPGLFSVFVLMAVITTLMASPLFELVYGQKARQRGELERNKDVQGDQSVTL